MSLNDILNPKQIAKNWNTVRSNPYASLKFQYMLSKFFIIIICAFIAYQIYFMVMRYDSGSNLTTLVMKIILSVIGVVVVIKFYGTLAPMKKSLQQYELNPTSIKERYKGIDVAKEVDDIFERIEANKRVKEMNKKINESNKI